MKKQLNMIFKRKGYHWGRDAPFFTKIRRKDGEENDKIKFCYVK